MSTAVPTALPTGISAPLTEFNSSDHTGLIAISASLGLILVFLSVSIRAYYRLWAHIVYKHDSVFILASVFSCIQASLVFLAIHYGLGKINDLIQPDHLIRLQKNLYASNILYLATIYYSKFSTALILAQISPFQTYMKFIWALGVFITISAIASIILIAVPCNPSHPWVNTTSDVCPKLASIWEATTVLDIITELGLFGIAVYMVIPLRMKMKSKVSVILAFGFRLPLIMFIALRLKYLLDEIHSSEPYFAASSTAALTQCQIGFSIFAVIIPSLKAFMSPFEKTSNTTTNSGDMLSSHLTTKSTKSNYQYPNNKKSFGDNGHAENGVLDFSSNDMKLRPDGPSYEAAAGYSGRDDSIHSQDSQIMIIKKDIEIRVAYDRPGSAQDCHELDNLEPAQSNLSPRER